MVKSVKGERALVVRSHDVSAGVAQKAVPKRNKLAAFTRPAPKKLGDPAPVTKMTKADHAKTHNRKGEDVNASPRWDSLIKRQGAERDRKEAERLAKVTAFTDNEIANVKKASDTALLETLIAALTLRDREANSDFRDQYERCKVAVRAEIEWRLKTYRAAAMGHPKPVQITKERPVYGKSIDARAKKPDKKKAK